VLAVERLLAEEGGVTGGWDMRDHDRSSLNLFSSSLLLSSLELSDTTIYEP